MKRPRTEEDVLAGIEERFARWDQIMREGCNDPGWPDGINLNLVRNHILYHMKELAEVTSHPVQLSMFDTEPSTQGLREVPPKVPPNFMVRRGKYAKDRIRRFEARGETLVYDWRQQT